MIKSVDAKDRVVSSAHSRELKKLGYPTGLSSAPAAYLTGLLLAKRAIKLGIDSAVLDTGIYARKPRSNVYAFLKGCVEGGLNVPHSQEVFADDSRVNGKHIAAYAQMLKDSAPEKYSKIFSLYIKAGAPPESLVELVETVKSKLDSIVGGV
jgi:large subunit ribosomal protein L18